jgi:hypothetical protein
MKKIETDFVKFYMENDILIGEFICEKLDLYKAKEILRLRLELTGGTSYKTCADSTQVKEFTKEARDFMSQGDAYKNISAFAAVTNNSVTRMILNFYLRLKPHPLPTKLFNNRAAGIDWLKTLDV